MVSLEASSSTSVLTHGPPAPGLPLRPGGYRRGPSRRDTAAIGGATHACLDQPQPLGDVDCSGEIESVDALALLRFLVNIQPAPMCIDLADAQCDGDKDVVDALQILWEEGFKWPRNRPNPPSTVQTARWIRCKRHCSLAAVSSLPRT